jgi:hypothetical protein
MPGRLRSSLAMFFARFSIVPGMWQRHRQSLQSTWFPLLQSSDNFVVLKIR